MKFIKELLEAQAEAEDSNVNADKPEIKSSADTEDDIEDDTEDGIEDDEDDTEDDEYADDDDIGSVSVRQGYDKEKTEMFMFGANRPVTILSKEEEDVDDKTLQTKYIINPKTGAWVYKVGLSSDDMIEIKNGEDPSSLLKHLKRKTKISSRQVSEYFSEET